jgi:hypothetical protein
MERLLVTPLSRFPQGTPIRLGRHPIYHLCHATVRRARREGFARQADRRMVGLRFRRSDHFRREPRHAECRWRQGRTRRRRRLAAGPCGPCACSTRCRMPASSMSRRPARPRSTISPMPSGSASGAARISPSPPAPSSSRRSRPAASRRWKCWPATCGARPLYRPLALLRRRRIRAGRARSRPTSSVRIYDAYAGAFAVIHNNLDAAMQAANITGATGTLNRQAKSAARSAFEAPSSASSAICSRR